MDFRPWEKWSRGFKLSMFIDGELERPAMDRLREQLVFDRRLKNAAQDFERVDELVEEAWTERDLKSLDERVAQIDKALELDTGSELVGPQKAPRKIKPALVASLGVLITAGITLAELRRRGVV